MSESNVFLMFTTTSSLNDSPSLEWSQDDFICLLTEKGAFVFTPEFSFADSTNSLYPHKHFIPNPVDPPPLGISSTVKKFIYSQQAKCDWFHHIHLTDGFSSHYCRYQLAAWSPRIKQFGSILALITYDHRLVLYVFQNNEWKQLADCSSILDTKLGDHYRGISSVKAYELLAKLAIQSMSFSCVFELEGVETVLLACPSQSGHCHFFRINLTNWLENVDDNDSVNLVNTWKTGLASITYCSWFKNFLILCSLDGQLIIYKIPVDIIDCTFNDWPLIPQLTLWSEKDFIPVQHIIMTEIEVNKYKIIFTKNDHIIILILKEINIDDKEILQLDDDGNSLSIIPSQSSPYITGMSLLPNDDLILSSPGSLITTMKINGIKLEPQTSHPINLDEVASNMSPLSLKTSRNNVLTCVAQMITKLHDHLLLKEPTRIIIFPNISFNELTMKLESLINDSDLKTKYSSLHDIMDLLNSLRGYYATNCSWIPSKLKQAFDEPIDFEDNSLNLESLNLQVLRFVCLALSQNNLINLKVDEFERVLNKLESLILRRHVKNMYEKLVNEQEKFNSNQCISFNNITIWAEKCDLIVECPKKVVTECCPICDGEISMEDPKEAICSSDHKLIRCCNSLIACDLISIQYRQCKLCGRCLFAVPSIWKDSWECLYCY